MLFIYISSVSYFDNQYSQYFIFDIIYHSIVSYADAIDIFKTSQFFTSIWTWIVRQSGDMSDYVLIIFIWNLIQLLLFHPENLLSTHSYRAYAGQCAHIVCIHANLFPLLCLSSLSYFVLLVASQR